MDHVALVADPAYADADVLDVRGRGFAVRSLI